MQAPRESDVQAIGQEGNEDVCLDAGLKLWTLGAGEVATANAPRAARFTARAQTWILL